MGKTGHNWQNTYIADFETGKTDSNECFVWLWCIMDMNGGRRRNGSNIGTFLDSVRYKKCKSQTIYFHNLKYDGTYIVSYLLRNGFKCVNDKKLEKYQFSVLISKGSWYTIRVRFENNTTKFVDSLKLMPLSVREIGKLVGNSKGDLGEHYNITDIDYKPTDEDVEYCYTDCDIVRMGLLSMFDMKIDRLTIASSSLTDLRRQVSKTEWEELFPDITDEQDEEIRQSYCGGFCYVNPDIAEREIGSGGVIDVNSLYPSVLHDRPLPCGKPLWITSELLPPSMLGIFHINATFSLKNGYLPTLMRKQQLYSNKVNYITEGNKMDLWITSVDFALMQEHYNISYEFLGGWAFKTLQDVNPLRTYIDKWIAVKIQATEEGNKILRQIAKLMLNSCYGKFGSKRYGYSEGVELKDDGTLKKVINPELQELKHYYLPVAVFCTAWARDKTIRTAQMLHSLGKFCYSDTDSIHYTDLSVDDLKALGIDVHPTRLGAWDFEGSFSRAKFIRQKCYIEEKESGLSVHICGCPSVCNGKPIAELVNFDNFETGLTIDGKLVQKSMNGGTYLESTQFTLV